MEFLARLFLYAGMSIGISAVLGLVIKDVYEIIRRKEISIDKLMPIIYALWIIIMCYLFYIKYDINS